MKNTLIVMVLAFAAVSSAFPKEKSDSNKRGLFNIFNNLGGGNLGVNPGSYVDRPTFGGNFNAGFNGGLNSGFGGGVAKPSSGCRYWCRTPQGQAYCCEGENEPQSAVGIVKPGRCPPVRPVCPPTRSFGPPQTCSNDGACGGFDKCCFDTCLQEHVCKAPLGYGR